MEDCIFKGDAYIELMKCKDFDTDKLYHGNHYLKIACDVIRSIPPVDVVERKKGKWEDVEVKFLDEISVQPDSIASMYCPICGRYADVVRFYGNPRYLMNYCPNCGAEMISEQ